MTECLERTDIADRADVEAVLWRFYGAVLVDDVLAEPFAEVREVTGLAAHIPVMTDFWETMLFKVRRYHGQVQDVHGRVHATTALSTRHFIRWLTTWYDTVDDMHSGPQADRAKRQAARICWSMHRALTGGDDVELNELVRRCTALAVAVRRAGDQPRSTDATT